MNNEQTFVSLLEEGCQSWRQGDDQKGIQLFQQACLLWMDWLEEQNPADAQPTEPSKDSHHHLVQSMENLIHTLNQEDIIRATDILEYEILPLIKSME